MSWTTCVTGWLVMRLRLVLQVGLDVEVDARATIDNASPLALNREGNEKSTERGTNVN